MTPGSGWETVDFPVNAVVNDKLYLNEELKNKIITLLDQFIETTYINDTEATATGRGFKLLELQDIYQNKISAQESSSVSPHIWFGVSTTDKVFVWKNDKLEPFRFPYGDNVVSDRLHLTTQNAKKLKKIIDAEWTLIAVIAEKEKLEDAIPLTISTTPKVKRSI